MSVETVELVEVDVDLDAAVPCEWFYGCSSEAEWAGRHLCCPRQFKLCGTHYEQSKRDWIKAAWMGPIQCLHCGTNPMPEPTWRPV